MALRFWQGVNDLIVDLDKVSSKVFINLNNIGQNLNIIDDYKEYIESIVPLIVTAVVMTRV